MRLQVLDKNGIQYGGRRYAEGEELEIEDTSRGRAWAAAFIVQRKARKFEPVLVGSPTPAPKPVAKAAPVGAPPESPTPTAEQEPSAPPPAFQPEEDAVEGDASDETEEGDEARPRRGRPPIHGRYSRRDVRPEE